MARVGGCVGDRGICVAPDDPAQLAIGRVRQAHGGRLAARGRGRVVLVVAPPAGRQCKRMQLPTYDAGRPAIESGSGRVGAQLRTCVLMK